MKSVFIVTHQQGFESDPVIDSLRKNSIPVFRFNSDDKEISSQISLTINKGGVDIFFVCDGRRIGLDEIGIGWCQQLPPYLNQASSVEENLQRENLWTAQMAAFELLEGKIPWLNSVQCVLGASNKPRQLWEARSVGLEIPDTLISNTPGDIRTFSSRLAMVAKNLSTPWVILSNQEVDAAYTRIVPQEWLESNDDLAFCPVIYQQYFERRRDYRVVVVGKEVFSVCCEPTEEQREDIRLASRTGEGYYPCEFDKTTLDKLRLLMEKLSIQYCGADFIEDKSGKLYFLEVNTCGAWWWADRLYGGAICQAIANYLKDNLK